MASRTQSCRPTSRLKVLRLLQGLNLQVGGNQGVNVSNHPTDQGFPSIVFSDGTNFTPIGRDHVGPTQSTTKQIADNITYSRGRHTIRAGVDIRWVRFAVPEIETPSDDYGLFTFNQNTFTGSSFGDLLLGAPNTTYFAVTGPRDDAGGAQTGIYGQDQWQVNDRLTLNFGLRWELLPPFVDKNGIQANFDPNYSGPGANGQGAVIVNNILLNGLKPAPAFLASFNACGLAGINPNYNSATCTPVVTNGQDGLPAGLRQTYLRNFDPRVSLAYRPFKDNKTVIRAGFGIFTVTALGHSRTTTRAIRKPRSTLGRTTTMVCRPSRSRRSHRQGQDCNLAAESSSRLPIPAIAMHNPHSGTSQSSGSLPPTPRCV